MITVEMEFPDEMKIFAMPKNKEEQPMRRDIYENVSFFYLLISHMSLIIHLLLQEKNRSIQENQEIRLKSY